MPFSQKRNWTEMQNNCNVHNTVRYLIKVGQRPNRHKTKGDNTLIKHLYGYFLEGKLLIDEEGTILIKVPEGHYNGYAVSIPPALAPGLIQCLHIRMQHPSKAQMFTMVARYFHTIGLKRIIDLTVDNCHQCLSLKPLPKILTEHSTTVPQVLGSRFSADVIERHSQRILAVRDSLSSFTSLSIIPDQTAATLKEATLLAILPLIPDSGAVIRVDGATAWQSLAAEAEKGSGIWGKYNIKIEVGNLISVNKNPEAENCVREVHKEILRLSPDIKAISKLELAQVQKQINSRVRYKGWAAQEIVLGRDQVEGKKLDIPDEILSSRIAKNRQDQHDRVKVSSGGQNFAPGDLVLLKTDLNKTHARDPHIVVAVDDKKIHIKKLHSQFRKQTYKADPLTLIKLPQTDIDPKTLADNSDKLTQDNPGLNKAGRPKRAAARKAPQAWANLNCVRCRSHHRVGWCPEDQDEDPWDILLKVPARHPTHPDPINVQTPPPGPGVKAKLPPRPPINPKLAASQQRSQSPSLVSSTQNPNFRSPTNATKERCPRRAKVKLDYKELNTKGTTK